MKQELELIEKLEVIETSSSEWSNPIVLVPKKDGSLRFYLDFRYWQVPLCPVSKELTAFKTPFGHYQFREILSRVKSAGLTIPPDKCAIAKQEVSYLGHVLGHGVIRPQVGKVDAIKQAVRPTTKKQDTTGVSPEGGGNVTV
ncbi:uncharacterized protein LOC120486734 [Tachysurus ichikawai]